MFFYAMNLLLTDFGEDMVQNYP